MANKKVTARGKRGKKAKEPSLPLQPSPKLTALSLEVIYLIATFLDPLGVNKLALVCRAFKGLLRRSVSLTFLCFFLISRHC